ncbi:protein kinase domain-containing protein [Nocardioides litoris]|uniref:protein kinase domain-containing protein n=1 Tax=Nocardioides litoris TaxID=1926648 RepID=UPI00112470D6|nr:protein kinase [Nocardioides litoris]
MSAPSLAPGAAFGPYRIERVLGVGGAGVVYLATDLRLQRKVALKTLLSLQGDGAATARFEREAATLARLESPHVIQVFDHGVHEGTVFLAMQHAGGGDLGRVLRERGPMPPVLAATLCAQVAEALRDAHEVGVVHRDVKPANVLLRDDRLDRPHAFLGDFGLAHTADAPASMLTAPGAVAGTWTYLAPERVAGRPATAASDVYAVGCLLWETLTGRPPYDGSDVEVAAAHQRAPVPQLAGDDEMTVRLNRVLAGALAKDPALRTPSAAALRGELREVAGLGSTASGRPLPPPAYGPAPVGSPVGIPGATSVRPPSWPPGTPTPGRRSARSRWVLPVATALAVALVAVGIAVVVGGDDGDGDGGTDPSAGTGASGAPADPPASAAAPVTERPIRGDLDRNGFGDVALLTLSSGLQVLRSDGTSFRDPRVRPAVDVVGLVGDVDADGRSDVLRVQGDPPRLSVSLGLAGSPTSPVRLPDSPEVLGLFEVQAALGDVTGDGFPDLAAITPIGDGELQVDVSVGDGTGVFAPAVPWFTGTHPAHQVAAADVDGDGRVDLVLLDDGSEGEGGVRGEVSATVLASTGSAFEPLGEPSPVEDGLFGIQAMRAGDLDGDGVDEVVALSGGYAPTITAWRWADGAFTEEPFIADGESLADDSSILTSELTVSDVDGDRRDDVVLVLQSSTLEGGAFTKRFAVYTSDGQALTREPSFDREVPVPENESLSVLDNVAGPS